MPSLSSPRESRSRLWKSSSAASAGERIIFRQTAADTDGELIAIDLELPPGGGVPGGLHIHPLQEERFEVIRGVMRLRMRRDESSPDPARSSSSRPTSRTTSPNVGDDTALVRLDIRPTQDGTAVRDGEDHLAGDYRGRRRRPRRQQMRVRRGVRARLRHLHIVAFGRSAGSRSLQLFTARFTQPQRFPPDF